MLAILLVVVVLMPVRSDPILATAGDGAAAQGAASHRSVGFSCWS